MAKQINHKYEARIDAHISWHLADGKPVGMIWFALCGEKSDMIMERHEHVIQGPVYGAKTVGALIEQERKQHAIVIDLVHAWAADQGLNLALEMQDGPWVSVMLNTRRVKG